MQTTIGIPERIIKRYARDHKLSIKEASEKLAELEKYLEVCASSEGTHAPSRPLDHLWHTFVLFTQDYAEYCQKKFGRFIHHQPTENRMPGAYLHTRKMAEQKFGKLDPKIWPENAGGAAICNDCCEDNPGGGHPQG